MTSEALSAPVVYEVSVSSGRFNVSEGRFAVDVQCIVPGR